MAGLDERTWLEARLRAQGGEWVLTLRDPHALVARLAWRAPTLRRRIAAWLASHPGLRGEAIPVFFQAPRSQPGFGAQLRARLASWIDAGRLALVELGRDAAAAPPAQRLAPELAVLGDVDPDVLSWLDGTRRAPALAQVRMSAAGYLAAGDDGRDDGRWIEIAVATARSAAVLEDASQHQARWEVHPRLLLVADRPAALRQVFPGRPRMASSVLIVPFVDDPAAAGELIRRVTDELGAGAPLHEAVRRGARATTPELRPRLITTPRANWSIAIEDAPGGVADGAAEEQISSSPVPAIRDPARGDRSADERPVLDLDDGQIEDEDGIPAPVRRDSSTLFEIPSIEPEEGPAAAGRGPRPRRPRRRGDSKSLIAAPPPEQPGMERDPLRQSVPTVSPPIPRAVDIALRRVVGPGVPHDPRAPAIVDPTTRLGAGRRYALRVQIGRVLPGSLFRGRPPALDRLLPPSAAGHHLDVTVFALDFALASPGVQRLWLPRLGATEIVRFLLDAPARPGPARCRVVVSHGDHALQVFVVTAQIAAREESAAEPVLVAALEHAATRRFDNLALLRPRAATAVVNDDPLGSHSITLKRGDRTGTFRFGDDQIRAASAAVRRVLEDAARSGQFDEPPPAAGSDAHAARVAAHHAVIRTLAALGANLQLALFDHADPGGRQLLGELLRGADQRLQLIHVARSLVIPWSTLYDGWVPDDLDTSRLEVCDGVTGDGAACGHGADERLVCMRRFWGLRHDVELMLGSAEARDAITSFQIPADRPPLRVLHGRTLQRATFMPAPYVSLLYRPGVPVWDHDVYTLLEPELRPAIVVAMGHFSLTTPVPGATVHAIDLIPAALTNIGVSKQALRLGDWEWPRSIVLLLACSSAVTAADALTGMIDAFAGAGAAAIIGTETTVFPRLSARAACSIVDHLVHGRATLASALRTLRWELVRDASPLGFSFTAYGNADLTREQAT